jgi:hypothetical protein
MASDGEKAMTINKECVVKSLKTDYLQIGYATAATLILVAIGIGAYYAALSSRQSFYDLMTFISNILSNLFTAVNVLIVGEILVIAVLTSLITASIKEQQQLKEKAATPVLILTNSTAIVGIWCIYAMQSYFISTPPMTLYQNSFQVSHNYLPPYPDVLPILVIILIINAFVLCPAVIAYARCKE